MPPHALKEVAVSKLATTRVVRMDMVVRKDGAWVDMVFSLRVAAGGGEAGRDVGLHGARHAPLHHAHPWRNTGGRESYTKRATHGTIPRAKERRGVTR